MRSYAEQAAHYFGRPHETIPEKPLRTPAAWRGCDLAGDPSWRSALGPDALDEIEATLARLRAENVPVSEVTRASFPLACLRDEIAGWRRELREGRGFQVIRGFPVERLEPSDAERFFWALGQHLGEPGAQNPQGDLLGHVLDTGDARDDPLVRLYRTSSSIAYHCDAADAVGLLCLRSAARGGESRIASTVTIFNRLLETEPELAQRLFEPVRLDLRNEHRPGTQPWIEVPPARCADGRLRIFYHSDYFRSVVRHPEAAPLSALEQRLFDRFEEIGNDPEVCLDMDLAPGDVQLLSNHTIVHARRAYEDAADPAQRRHLLRLWLSL